MNAVLREMTNMSGSCDRLVVKSSVMPSAKYCCLGSSLRLANGSTTIDRRGAIMGFERAGLAVSVVIEGGPRLVTGQIRQPITTRTKAAAAARAAAVLDCHHRRRRAAI